MLLIFIIPLLLIYIARRNFNYLSMDGRHYRVESGPVQRVASDRLNKVVFNRVHDLSKLIGCDTRNVTYRWKLFSEELERLKFNTMSALDFGAGSLRDTYELACRGFKVDAYDINMDQMKVCYDAYDWSKAGFKPRLIQNSLDGLHELHDQYELIIAFDVIEHLTCLDTMVELLKSKLTDSGTIFVSVPNCKSLIERYFKFWHMIGSKELKSSQPGVPHVNFMTPDEWASFFRKKGFDIKAHDMTIGYFVNDVWFGLYSIPSRLCIIPFINAVASLLHVKYTAKDIEKLFYPRWLMSLVNELDEVTKGVLKDRWGWNLFILTRRQSYARS